MFEMYDKNPGLSNEKIKLLEERFGISLPESYKSFLSQYNGGRPITGSFDFADGEEGSTIGSFLKDASIRDSTSFISTYKAFQGRYPEGFFPIAQDAFGNLVLLGISDEHFDNVFFWDHELEYDPDQGEELSMLNMKKISNSFQEFKDSLYEYIDDFENE